MTAFAAPIIDALDALLPDPWRVGGYLAAGTRVERTTVCVWTTDIGHMTGTSVGYTVGYTVQLLVPNQDARRVDAVLDAALEQLVTALVQVPDVVLDKGERTVTNDNSAHAWVLTVRQGITITQED